MNTDLAAQRAFDRMKKGGFDRLSEEDKILATVWTFDGAVANRGFAGYYSRPEGDMASYAPTALAKIGATGMVAIATQANEVFGPNGPSRDRETRRKQLEALGPDAKARFAALDAEYFKSEEDLDELLELYLSRKP